MGRFRHFILTAAAFTLAGCLVIPKPKPFAQSVAARQMEGVEAAIDAPPAASPAGTAVVSAATPSPAPAEAAAATSTPARTDIKGAGDGSMKLDRVVITAEDVPHRAPDFSSEQAAAMLCAATKGGFGEDNARRMHEATVKAEQARKDYDARRISLKEMNRLELKRQDAVRAYLMPVPLLGMVVDFSEKKSDMPPPVFRSAVLENTDLFSFTENGREVIAVSGVARNTGAERVELPPLTLRAIDKWGFSLAGQSSLLPFAALAPGEAKAFEVRFLNPPANTAEVYLHFAPPFMYRSRRDCEFFDPRTFDPMAKLDAAPAAASPAPQSGGSTDYTASELNQLTLFYRRESEIAWRCQNGVSAGCVVGSGAQRLHWRDMYVMSEAIDEAWVAVRAAEESRRRMAEGKGSQAEADAAELARQRAVARFKGLGERALARAGGSAKDVEVAMRTSTYGRDEDGLYVEIGGTMRNTSGAERKVDSLMVAFVDRLELPLSSVAVEAGVVLAPGETKEFSHRLQASTGRERGGRMTIGERRRDVAPARIPPRSVPWEVRVGAMTREQVRDGE